MALFPLHRAQEPSPCLLPDHRQELGVTMRLQKNAVYVDYVHNCEYADENLDHIDHI